MQLFIFANVSSKLYQQNQLLWTFIITTAGVDFIIAFKLLVYPDC